MSHLPIKKTIDEGNEKSLESPQEAGEDRDEPKHPDVVCGCLYHFYTVSDTQEGQKDNGCFHCFSKNKKVTLFVAISEFDVNVCFTLALHVFFEVMRYLHDNNWFGSQ